MEKKRVVANQKKKDYNVLIGDSIQNESGVGVKKNLQSSIFFAGLIPAMSSEITFFFLFGLD